MPAWTTKTNRVDTIDAAHINDLQKHISWECPEYYGAVGDGVTDDTAAIQAAIAGAEAGSKWLRFGPKTYIVGPVGSNPRRCLALTAGIKIAGSGIGKTIIKVKDSAGSYCWLMNGAAGVDLTGLEVSGITFDHNITNNALPAGGAYSATNDANITICAYAGTDISIHDCEIKNASSVNNIVVNGSTCERVSIYNNKCSVCGDDGNSIAHDASFIYTHANQVSIYGNQFESSGQNDPGAITAIETHGHDTIVTGNVIVNFSVGMNISGIEAADSTNIVVSNNTINGAHYGMFLWSAAYGAHTTGYGLDGVIISGNTINLAGNSVWTSGTSEVGISFYPGGVGLDELDINNVLIDGNTITHPLESGDVGNNSASIGIGWWSLDNKTLSNSRITNNTIINFPMCGIRLSCYILNVVVSGNLLINCGSTLDADFGDTSAYRQPFLSTSANVADLLLENNTFVETNATTRPAFMIYLYQDGSTVAANVRLLNNTFVVTGTGLDNQVYISNAGGVLNPYMAGEISGFLPMSASNQKFSLGSHIYDSSNGRIYEVGADQYTWSYRTPYDVCTLTTAQDVSGAKTFSGKQTFTNVLGTLFTVGSGHGVVTIIPLDSTYTPYIEWRDGNGTRFGYIGNSSANFPIVLENSAIFEVLGGNAYFAGNVGFGTESWGTSATLTLAQKTGVAPSSSPADEFQMYSADIAAGNAAPHFRTEAGDIVKIYSESHIVDASESHAVTDPGDAPADADALRDDLVTNTIPSIETALNNLGAKLNDVLAALEAQGLLKSS